jgi:rod shape-determining protein MreD
VRLGLVAIGATAVVAMVLQSTVFAQLLPLTGVIPNFMLVLVVILAVHHQSVRGVVAAFVLGYVLDTFVGTTLGMHAFAFTIVYTVIVVVGRVFRIDRGASLVVAVALAGCIHALVTAAVADLAYGGPPMGEALRHGAVEALVTAVLSPPVLAVVEWQDRLLGVEPG